MFSDETLVSKSDIEEKTTLMSELKTRVEELKMANEYQLRLKDMCASHTSLSSVDAAQELQREDQGSD